MDYLSYRLVAFGFLFLTIVILSGAIWAEQAWSAFWTWDPKEVWALITWIIYAVYLHLRLRAKAQRREDGLVPGDRGAGGVLHLRRRQHPDPGHALLRLISDNKKPPPPFGSGGSF